MADAVDTRLKRSIYLDALRAVALVRVVLFHATGSGTTSCSPQGDGAGLLTRCDGDRCSGGNRDGCARFG